MFTNEFEVKCGGAKQTKANRMDELGRAVRSGNVDCMDELFELASSYAFRIAKRMVATQEDAEDIAQEAMLQLFKAILKYSKDFGGSLSDKDTMTFAKVSPNTYYKYKSELKQEMLA